MKNGFSFFLMGGLPHVLKSCEKLMCARREYFNSWPDMDNVPDDLGESLLHGHPLGADLLAKWRAVFIFAGAVNGALASAVDRNLSSRSKTKSCPANDPRLDKGQHDK